jgi:hypothetical protein
LPGFSWYNIPKRKKYTPNTTKYIKCPLNKENVRKVDQMSAKYTNISIAIPSKIYTTLDFWFEKIPSDNPVISSD